jgi:AraC-like DNA-binding protein
VAWACGFAAPSYFIRTFREHHGMTPKAWRETGSGTLS